MLVCKRLANLFTLCHREVYFLGISRTLFLPTCIAGGSLSNEKVDIRSLFRMSTFRLHLQRGVPFLCLTDTIDAAATVNEMEEFNSIKVFLRSSPQQADVHRTSAFNLFKSLRSASKKTHPCGVCLFWRRWRDLNPRTPCSA